MMVNKKIKNMASVMFFLFVFFCENKKIFCLARFDYDYLNDGKNYNFNLPESYDSHEKGFVTSIKTQGKSGPCWAFAIISTLESNYLKENNLRVKKDWEIDFSEMNMIFNLNKGTSLNNPYEFDFELSGNNEMASAYFASGRGPVFEQDDIYKLNYEARDYKENLNKKACKYIKKIIYVPDPDKNDEISLKNHRELVKKFIYENGSVATNIYFNESFFDNKEKNYFYGFDDRDCNHACTIVGWDDNYSRDNFNAKNKLPEKNGAFIIKNSWGQNGYIYISYEDTFAGHNCCVMQNIVDAQEKYRFENIYQHDYFGMTSAIEKKILEGKKYIASVFDLKTEKEALSEIGIFIASNNTRAKIFLLKVNNSGEIIGHTDFLCEQRFNFPGYYVIDLPEKILLEDKKFGIGIEFLGCDFYIACETRENLFSSKAIGEKNQNFYGDKYGFQDFYSKQYNFTNFCIKAFTEKDCLRAKKADYKTFVKQQKLKEKNSYLSQIDLPDKNKNKEKHNLKSVIKLHVLWVSLIALIMFVLKIIFKK